VIDHEIIEYIEKEYADIEQDINSRNSTARPKSESRKKREELSISASKSIKKEVISVSLSFD